jgi:hypothetical protein
MLFEATTIPSVTFSFEATRHQTAALRRRRATFRLRDFTIYVSD